MRTFDEAVAAAKGTVAKAVPAMQSMTTAFAGIIDLVPKIRAACGAANPHFAEINAEIEKLVPISKDLAEVLLECCSAAHADQEPSPSDVTWN